VRAYSVVSCGTTAEAENHSVIAISSANDSSQRIRHFACMEQMIEEEG